MALPGEAVRDGGPIRLPDRPRRTVAASAGPDPLESSGIWLTCRAARSREPGRPHEAGKRRDECRRYLRHRDWRPASVTGGRRQASRLSTPGAGRNAGEFGCPERPLGAADVPHRRIILPATARGQRGARSAYPMMMITASIAPIAMPTRMNTSSVRPASLAGGEFWVRWSSPVSVDLPPDIASPSVSYAKRRQASRLSPASRAIAIGHRLRHPACRRRDTSAGLVGFRGRLGRGC